MNNRYLITLKPTGKFFFGGEMTFQVGKNDSDDFNSQFSSYIIKSNCFPQQTSLLGMLRFLILRNAGPSVFKNNRVQDPKTAAGIIGESGFRINGNKVNDFGLIRSIGPCFIMDGVKPVMQKEFAFDYKIKVNSNESIESNFKAKEYNSDCFAGVFCDDERMGVDKKDYKCKSSQKEDDKSLVKQVCKRFVDVDKKKNTVEHDYKFAFHAEIDEAIELEKYSGQLVSVGADSSVFVLNIKKTNEEIDFVDPCENHEGEKVVLASPAFIEANVVKELAQYAITEIIPFRFMKTSVGDTHFHRIPNRSKNPNDNTQRLNLYDRGSVFFFKDAQCRKDFLKAIEEKEDFRQIGYNQYK